MDWLILFGVVFVLWLLGLMVFAVFRWEEVEPPVTPVRALLGSVIWPLWVIKALLKAPKMARSPTFSADVGEVLSSALNAGLTKVALIGYLPNGEAYVASSVSTPETLELFDNAPAEIDKIRESKD